MPQPRASLPPVLSGFARKSMRAELHRPVLSCTAFCVCACAVVFWGAGLGTLPKGLANLATIWVGCAASRESSSSPVAIVVLSIRTVSNRTVCRTWLHGFSRLCVYRVVFGGPRHPTSHLGGLYNMASRGSSSGPVEFARKSIGTEAHRTVPRFAVPFFPFGRVSSSFGKVPIWGRVRAPPPSCHPFRWVSCRSPQEELLNLFSFFFGENYMRGRCDRLDLACFLDSKFVVEPKTAFRD